MAHLWIRQPDAWGVLPLSGGRLLVTGDPANPVSQPGGADPGTGELVRESAPNGNWVLLCAPGAVRVNGQQVHLGIRVLADRDEIVAGRGSRFFFSTELLARVVPFAGSPEPTICLRCRQAIDAGTPAVSCPNCGVAYHQHSEAGLPCWTYAKCGICGQDSSLEAGFRWSPEDL